MAKKIAQWQNRIVGEGIISADQLKANPKNWRTHGDQQRKTMDSALDQIGWIQRVIVNKTTGNIVDGHLRVEQAVSRGEDVPVLYVELSESEEMLALATIDPISAMAGSDQDMVDQVIESIQTEDESLLELIEGLRDEPFKKEGLTDPDDVPEVPVKPINQLGDIWILGNHRLMCGDSTNIEDVKMLMDGQKTDMVFTDPPYGISVVGKNGSIGKGVLAKEGTYREVIGDDKPYNPSHLWACFPDSKCILWGANYYMDKLPLGGRWFVWDKNRPEGTTFSDCELAWSNIKGIVVKKYSVTWQGMIREGESGKRVHPTQKPILLIKKILSSFPKDKIIADVFGGSGSTLIACEDIDRICFMMELDPQYCDVIINRWQDYTGNEATHEDGRLFNDLEPA